MTEVFRKATEADLPAIVALLADDPLGAGRETPDLGPYRRAFSAIDADPDEFLLVVEADGRLLGTLQLTFLHGLARGGAIRAQVEGVRVAAEARGRGLGRAMFDWVFAQARARGCALVQLTSDRTRTGAHAFYDGLGFVPSHTGFKKPL